MPHQLPKTRCKGDEVQGRHGARGTKREGDTVQGDAVRGQGARETWCEGGDKARERHSVREETRHEGEIDKAHSGQGVRETRHEGYEA